MKLFKHPALLGFVLGIVVGVGGVLYVLGRGSPAPTPQIQPDTVYVDKIPRAVLEELGKLRNENLTLWERINGWKIPEKEGPVVIYLPTVKIDTALASVTIKNNYLYTRLQVPTAPDSAQLVQLPRVNIRDCRSLGIGGNGAVRCQTSPLGRLNLFNQVYTPVNIFDPVYEGGLEWYKGNLTVPLYYSTRTGFTIGVRHTLSIF